MIELQITNNYAFPLAYYPYNGGAYPDSNSPQTRIANKGTTQVITSEPESPFDPIFVDVPAMGPLLITQMNEDEINRYKKTDELKKQVASGTESYRYHSLLRYHGKNYYFMHDNPKVTIEVEFNSIGCMTIHNISAEKAVQIPLYSISAQYPFN